MQLAKVRIKNTVPISFCSLVYALVCLVAIHSFACTRGYENWDQSQNEQIQTNPTSIATSSCSAETCAADCCENSCVSLAIDNQHCGTCNNACTLLEVCNAGQCECIPGTDGCDPVPGQGGNEEPCVIGEEQSCYDGPAHTLSVGSCRSGTQICTSAGWSPCVGQILPKQEDCSPNALDEDCNGLVDDDSDFDGDGWTNCGGDCCDSVFDQCQDPALVNPGAYEFANGIDDDCDGAIDNEMLRSCSFEPNTGVVTPTNLVNALDLCTFTTEESREWGVLGAELLRANGQGQPSNLQTSVMTVFGSLIPARANQTLAVLSSGRARGVNDPDYDPWDTSYSSWESAVSAPESYTNVHSDLETSSFCPAAAPLVQDSVLLRIKMRVPTNARGFQYQFRFFSFEYPIYLCTQYNDFFLALLDSMHDVIPEDRNISFDAAGNPVTINSAFFTSCDPLQCNDPNIFPLQQGPDDNSDGCVDSLDCNPSTNFCETTLGSCPDGNHAIGAFTQAEQTGGATSWLVTTAPVIPGEIITLDLHIWDTSDSALDSTVLLDDFQWRSEPTGLATNKH